MSKKKKTKKIEASPIPETPKVELVPADLQLKWDSVTAVATTFTCLDKGSFPHTYHDIVKASLRFVAKLHENMVTEALKHPSAHMIPELKELQQNSKKEGQANEQESAKTAAN